DTQADTLVDVHLLHQAMDQLPEDQKDAVILFEVMGFSIKEIAEVQENTIGAVKTKISRARKRLRSLLTDPRTGPLAVGTLALDSEATAGTPWDLFNPLRESAVSAPAEQVITQALTPNGLSWFGTAWQHITHLAPAAASSVTPLLVAGLILTLPQDSTGPSPAAIDGRPVAESTLAALPRQEAQVDATSIPQYTGVISSVALTDTLRVIFPMPPEPVAPALPTLVSTPEAPALPPTPPFPVALEEPAEPAAPELPTEATIPNLPDGPVLHGNLGQLKRTLLRHLMTDGLIDSKNDFALFTFKDGGLQLNGEEIPGPLQGSYWSIFDSWTDQDSGTDLAKFNFIRSYGVVAIDPEFIAVGLIGQDGFHGGISGRLDLDETATWGVEPGDWKADDEEGGLFDN
ncbi:MAG: sigma-70 region 4 domain-containing protein, partial [Bacteroidota bacterium]